MLKKHYRALLQKYFRIRVPLVYLRARIEINDWGSYQAPGLRFLCPLCRDHDHLVSFLPCTKKSGKFPDGRFQWAHLAGSRPWDITLSPSFLSEMDGDCRLHCLIRDGVVEVLSDSKSLKDKPAKAAVVER